jgi:hypothetical protein
MQFTRPFALLFSAAVLAASGGCASHRVSSNVEGTASTSASASTVVLLAEDGLPGHKYKELGPIEVSVRKLTVFHSNPTKEQANAALTDKARVLGADAVVNITYESGVGFTTWGYMDAKGMAVRLAQ